MSNGSTTWSFTYDANGLRTQRTNGTTAYNYIYNGSQLAQMTVGGNTLRFTYDALGMPLTVTYNGTTYYYSTNVQGDIIAILDASGNSVVQYVYDAWGNVRSVAGTLASTLGTLNPLRYRGYVYDQETQLYYLQSRYYNPEIGRFLSADVFTSTGQGLLGNNMFAYCANNPVNFFDDSGGYPLQVAIEFLFEWIYGDGEPKIYSESSRLSRILKENKKMQSYVDNAIESYKKGDPIEPGSGEFTSDADGNELYLSTQHFDYSITVTKETRTTGWWIWTRKEERYTATVTVHDTYNFDHVREWNSFGNVMNNLAFIYDTIIGGADFEWYATYTYSTAWTVVP